jgi:hypothetical protein
VLNLSSRFSLAEVLKPSDSIDTRNIRRYASESSCWIIYCLEEELALQTVRLASQFGQWMKYQSAPSNSLPMETNFLNSPFHAELTISVLPTMAECSAA